MQNAMNKVLQCLEIKGQCIRAESHRHLAFFDIQLEPESMALQKLLRSANEISLHLRTKTIPIMRLIPELGIVRVQVALKEAEPVALMELYSGESIPSEMVFPFLLGEDDNGKKLWMDMNHNPHLLIAGASGSGKSTLLHTIIANALFLHALRYRNIWIFLSDPKRVEFVEYNNNSLKNIIPNISNSYDETVAQMTAIYTLMESRYLEMQTLRIRSIENDPQQFPLVLCIVDEVADLIMQDKRKQLQDLFIKIAQKGRAAGIFLVLATQRPSVDIITGLIKANFPGRVACKTASGKDSQVVLDRIGAESLLGRGDAILQNMKHESVRFQVAYTTPQDTITNFEWIKNNV
jgi:S-DNA-T family DNA segregation ATPase FtsK/SpoIIIE